MKLDFKSDRIKNLYRDEVKVVEEGISSFHQLMFCIINLKCKYEDPNIKLDKIKMAEYIKENGNTEFLQTISRMTDFNFWFSDNMIRFNSKGKDQISVYLERVYVNENDNTKFLNDIYPELTPDEYLLLDNKNGKLEESKYIFINLFPETRIGYGENQDRVGKVTFDAFIEVQSKFLLYIREVLSRGLISRDQLIKGICFQLTDSFSRLLNNHEFIFNFFNSKLRGAHLQSWIESTVGVSSNNEYYNSHFDPFDKGILNNAGDMTFKSNAPTKHMLLLLIKDLMITNHLNGYINGVPSENTLEKINEGFSLLNQIVKLSGDFEVDVHAHILPSMLDSCCHPSNTLLSKVIRELSSYLASPTKILFETQTVINSIQKELFDYTEEVMMDRYNFEEKYKENSITSASDDLVEMVNLLTTPLEVKHDCKCGCELPSETVSGEAIRMKNLSVKENYMYNTILTDIDLFANEADFATTKYGKEIALKKAAKIRDTISNELDKTDNQHYIDALEQLNERLQNINDYLVSRDIRTERDNRIFGSMLFPTNR